MGYYSYQPAAEGGYAEVPVVGEVIGVTADYHQSDLKTAIYPIVFKYDQSFNNELAIRIEKGNIRETLNSIHSSWESIFPKKPLEYTFLDDTFNRAYAKEKRMGETIGIFTGLAIFISCLGLFGLVAFAAEQRTKEIGIRKVLGANTLSIVGLLSRDFLKLVFLSLVIASPLAWYIMDKWLQDFAYSVEITWTVFLIAAIAAVGVALITICFQSVRAALLNPIQCLREE